MNKIKAIIFDWDNTIVDSFDHLVIIHQEVGRLLGWPSVTDQQIKEVWGNPFRVLIQKLWPEQDGKEYEKAYRDYILEHTVPAIEGAADTILKLKNTFLLGIVTATLQFEVEHFLTGIGLDRKFFFVIQGSGESEHHKPNPRVFDSIITVLEKRDILKGEVLYVGDSLFDFYAARDAGLVFIAVLTGSTSREQFNKAGVSNEMILCSITELTKYYLTCAYDKQ